MHFEFKSPTRRKLWKPALERGGSLNAKDALSMWHTAWLRIIENYTERHLTNPSDKLVALSGVASYFQEKIGDAYLAGLWRSTFLLDLLWSTNYTEIPKPSDYRAPSWSWASIDGPAEAVAQSDWVYESAAEIIDVETALVNPKHGTGLVRGGSATLKGKLVEIHREESSWRKIPADDLPDGYQTLDGDNWICRPDTKSNVPDRVYGIILHHVRSSESVVGLIIAEVNALSSSPLETKCFSRVGIFHASKAEASKVLRWSQDSVITII